MAKRLPPPLGKPLGKPLGRPLGKPIRTPAATAPATTTAAPTTTSFTERRAAVRAYNGKPRGTLQREGTFKGLHLIRYTDRPRHVAFPQIAVPVLHDRSWYVVSYGEDDDRPRVIQFLTDTLDDQMMGWARCVKCHQWFQLCMCEKGCTPPPTVYTEPAASVVVEVNVVDGGA